MATRLVAHSAALSEFVAGYHGDCGQTALLCALHTLEGTPLDAAHLGALVKADIAAHRASASGAEPLSSIYSVLNAKHLVKAYHPYAEPFTLDWLTLLRAQAGITPIIMEVANGQALPGDERGLHYHFICILGIQPAGYLTADGDHPAAAQGKLVNYDRTQLANARPCGLIVCQFPPKQPAPPPPPPAIDQLTQRLDEAQQELVTVKAQLTAAQAQVTTLKQQLDGTQPATALVTAIKAVL